MVSGMLVFEQVLLERINDMDELVNYIFKNIQEAETQFRKINKSLYSQRRFNRKAACFAIWVGGSLVLNRLDKKNINRKIRKLEKEIEELTAEKECKRCDD